MQMRPPAKACREKAPGGFRRRLGVGVGLTLPHLKGPTGAGETQPETWCLPPESQGNPHRWLPYVGHKAAECSPAQNAGPFVSRQLSDNF